MCIMLMGGSKLSRPWFFNIKQDFGLLKTVNNDKNTEVRHKINKKDPATQTGQVWCVFLFCSI